MVAPGFSVTLDTPPCPASPWRARRLPYGGRLAGAGGASPRSQAPSTVPKWVRTREGRAPGVKGPAAHRQRLGVGMTQWPPLGSCVDLLPLLRRRGWRSLQAEEPDKGVEEEPLPGRSAQDAWCAVTALYLPEPEGKLGTACPQLLPSVAEPAWLLGGEADGAHTSASVSPHFSCPSPDCFWSFLGR